MGFSPDTSAGKSNRSNISASVRAEAQVLAGAHVGAKEAVPLVLIIRIALVAVTREITIRSHEDKRMMLAWRCRARSNKSSRQVNTIS
jgi:hypothetical protein